MHFTGQYLLALHDRQFKHNYVIRVDFNRSVYDTRTKNGRVTSYLTPRPFGRKPTGLQL